MINIRLFLTIVIILIWIFLIRIRSSRANIISCDENPIYCQIIKNNKNLESDYAMNLSNLIYKASLKYNIPANLYAAILMQESSYTLGARGCHWGLRKKTFLEKHTSPENPDNLIESKVCSDFGMSMINYKTALSLKLDINRLTTDMEYSINAGAKILSGFKKRFERRDAYWFLRYNCGNKGNTDRDTCQNYKRLIERFM